MQPSHGVHRPDALARWLSGSALALAAFLLLMFLTEATGATHLVRSSSDTTPSTLPAAPCVDGATGPAGATGVPGSSGSVGATGASGTPGAAGDTGPSGPRGETGKPGVTGPSGATGPRGATGACGATGPVGASGTRGATGVAGPTGATGPAGVDAALLHYGAFHDTSTQTLSGANTAAIMSFNQNTPSGSNGVVSDGVSVVSGTRITMATAGVYTVQVTVQLTGGTEATRVLTWLTHNGTAVTRSTGSESVGASALATITRSFVVEAAAGDYYEIVWSASNASVTLAPADAADSPSRPGAASAAVSVTQVR